MLDFALETHSIVLPSPATCFQAEKMKITDIRIDVIRRELGYELDWDFLASPKIATLE